MSIVSNIVVYLVLWWLIFFMVLPWGIQPEENLPPGGALGAPAKPRLWLKFFITTALTFVAWFVVMRFIDSGIISFRV